MKAQVDDFANITGFAEPATCNFHMNLLNALDWPGGYSDLVEAGALV